MREPEMSGHVRERLWSVVESAVMEGVSAKDFKQEVAEQWGQAMQEKAESDSEYLSHIEAALASLSMGGELAEAERALAVVEARSGIRLQPDTLTRAYNILRAHLLAAAGNSKGEA